MEKYAAELTGQILLFGLLGKLLYMAPQKEWIQSLVEQDVFSGAPIGEDQPEIARGLALIQSWVNTAWEQDSNLAFTALEADHFRLFIGAGKVFAPPWESVYFSEDRLLFTEQTLQVRDWYRKYGMQIEQLYHEPDDHIGLELSFLAYLAQLGLQAIERQDAAGLAHLLRDQQAFLAEHPLRWANTWRALVDQHARTDFFRGVAWMVTGALSEMDKALKVALSAPMGGVENA